MSNRIALVTGGNRGIGFSIVHGLAKESSIGVINFTSRNEPKTKDGGNLVDDLSKKYPEKKFRWYPLDGSSEESCHKLIESVLKDQDHVDILINNAGMINDSGPAIEATTEKIKECFQVNTLAPFLLSQGFVKKMKERNYGRIINMSSGLGALNDMGGNHLPYRLSKASLNAVTKTFSSELKGTNILVNSMCPGFVKTDMTGGENSKASRTPEEGADTAIWLATLPNDNGITGKFFRDRKEIAF